MSEFVLNQHALHIQTRWFGLSALECRHIGGWVFSYSKARKAFVKKNFVKKMCYYQNKPETRIYNLTNFCKNNLLGSAKKFKNQEIAYISL